MRFQFTLRNTAFISTLLTCGADVKADTIVAGTQYQLSTSGQEDLGFGLISTTGKPIGPGNTSFVIRRLADATLDPATAAVVPIQMIAVSLQSTAPVTVNGGLYNFFVHLTPGKLSLGTETIVETNPNLAPFQGWFTLDTKPYITVDFTPVGAGTAFSKDLQLTLTSSLTRWRHQPQAGEVVVSGSADPILDNCHDPHNGCSGVTFERSSFGVGSAECTTAHANNCIAAKIARAIFSPRVICRPPARVRFSAGDIR